MAKLSRMTVTTEDSYINLEHLLILIRHSGQSGPEVCSRVDHLPSNYIRGRYPRGIWSTKTVAWISKRRNVWSFSAKKDLNLCRGKRTNCRDSVPPAGDRRRRLVWTQFVFLKHQKRIPCCFGVCSSQNASYTTTNTSTLKFTH